MVFLASCLAIFSWNASPLDWGKQLYLDTKYVVSSPTRWNRSDWLNFSLTMGTAGGLMSVDERIRNFVQTNQSPTSDKLADIFNPLGAEGAVIILGGMYLGGYVTNNEKLKKIAILGSESAIISGMIVMTIKILVGRNRPYKEKGAFAWVGPSISGDCHSFPSGHTSTAFSIASSIADECENPLIDILAYGVATTVGLCRIYKDKHWGSDVFVGALIGTFVGKTLVRLKKTTK
ncbi:MAG TPA: phosphatase PAP2 family protein [bacterium (Candidatus Stahlbacteria)]|nr:phosphatase PAP2 family protein [Candidatus Stahlbacteria bacterium]